MGRLLYGGDLVKRKVGLLLFIFLVFPVHPTLADQGGSWEIDDDFIEDSIQDILEAFMDGFFEVAEGLWDEFVLLLQSEILGVDAELIILVLGTGMTVSKILTGEFLPRHRW